MSYNVTAINNMTACNKKHESFTVKSFSITAANPDFQSPPFVYLRAHFVNMYFSNQRLQYNKLEYT